MAPNNVVIALRQYCRHKQTFVKLWVGGMPAFTKGSWTSRSSESKEKEQKGGQLRIRVRTDIVDFQRGEVGGATWRRLM